MLIYFDEGAIFQIVDIDGFKDSVGEGCWVKVGSDGYGAVGCTRLTGGLLSGYSFTGMNANENKKRV